MDQAKQGADSLAAGDFKAAIVAYTAALKISPSSPDYYIKRSTAYQRSTPPDYAQALHDAENAVVLAHKRGKRELIVQSQLRRAIALFGLERYADANHVLGIVKRMDPNEKSLSIWEAKTGNKLQGLASTDAGAQVTVREMPSLEPIPVKNDIPQNVTMPGTAPASQGSGQSSIVQTPANKIRQDWYQNNDTVFFTLLAKGVPKDQAKINIHPRSLSISFPMATGSDYEFNLDPLSHDVDPAQSRYSVLPTKIEVILRKQQPGQKWHALESTEPVQAASKVEEISAIPSKASTEPVKHPAAIAYPTASRSGPKNWDKIVDDITTKKKKNDTTNSDSKDADDDDYDYDKAEGDEVNGFFKQLYAGATDDQKKAMMKSFLESNGTALSTNWADVKKGKVETQPPDGMVAKKWGS